MKTISPQRLHELHEAGETIELLDVRTPLEFREVHVPFARNVPLDSLNPDAILKQRNGATGSPLFVICRAGSRGLKACEKFRAGGIDDVVNVDGGTMAWEEAGLPVKRGRKAVSLERQVRIVAGLLVLVGALLGSFVHPYFVGISAFVGAGLMFAGITDWCGMAMLLAKMPWNQVSLECEVPKSQAETGNQ